MQAKQGFCLIREQKTVIITVLFFLLISPFSLAAKSLRVVTSIAPVAEFIEKVAGDYCQIQTLVPVGADPHIYELTPKQMKAVSQADIYVKLGSGLDFEQIWLDRLIALNPKMKVIDCSKGIRLRKMDSDSHRHHHHQSEHGYDPHIWLSPLNAIIMVSTIKEALIKLDPVNQDGYERNAENYTSVLYQLHQTIKKQLKKNQIKALMVFHPSWGYFASQYRIKQVPIEEDGKEPSAKALVRLIRLAKSKRIKTLFIAPQFSQKSAKMIASQIGATVMVIDPLAKEYVDNLKMVVNALCQS